MRTQQWTCVAAVLASVFGIVVGAWAAPVGRTAVDKSAPFTIVVMDPLAAPLSCPCVKGYAQRDYKQLAAHLEKKLGRKVVVAFSDGLKKAMESDVAAGRADLIIGKFSVVKADAARMKLPVEPVASLSGKDGGTTMTGMIVVRSNDTAETPADLNGYRIIFGGADADEKYSHPALVGSRLYLRGTDCVVCLELTDP